MTNQVGFVAEYNVRKIEHQTIITDKINAVFRTLIHILLNEKVNAKFNNKINMKERHSLFRDAFELPLDFIDSINFKFITPKGKQLKIDIDTEDRSFDTYDFNVSLLVYHQLIDTSSRDRKMETPILAVHRGLMYQSVLLKLFYSLMDILNVFNDGGECKVEIRVEYKPLAKISKYKPLVRNRCKRWGGNIKRVLAGDTLNVSTCKVNVIDLYILMHQLFVHAELDYLADRHLPGVLNANSKLNKFSTLELNLIYWLNDKLAEPMIQLGGLNNGLKLSIKKYSTIYMEDGHYKLFEDITLFNDVPYAGQNEAMNGAFRSGFYYNWFMQIAMAHKHHVAIPEHLSDDARYSYMLRYAAGFKRNIANQPETFLSKKEILDVFYQLITYSHFGLGPNDKSYADVFKTFEYVNNRNTLHDLLTGFYKRYYLELTLS